MKKFLSLALVLCMVLALGMSAFADVKDDPQVTLVYAEVNPPRGHHSRHSRPDLQRSC